MKGVGFAPFLKNGGVDAEKKRLLLILFIAKFPVPKWGARIPRGPAVELKVLMSRPSLTIVVGRRL